MTSKDVIVIVTILVLTAYLICKVLKFFSPQKIGVLELDIERAVPGRDKTHLFFQDIELPSGQLVQEFDMYIPTSIFLEMRKRKQFRVNVEIVIEKGFISGKFNSLVSR